MIAAQKPMRGQPHDLDIDEAQFLHDMLSDSLADSSGGASPNPPAVPPPEGNTVPQHEGTPRKTPLRWSSCGSTPGAGPEAGAQGELATDMVAVMTPLQHATLRPHYSKPAAPPCLRAHSVPCVSASPAPDPNSSSKQHSPQQPITSVYHDHTCDDAYTGPSVATPAAASHQQPTQSSHARSVSREAHSAVATAVATMEPLQAGCLIAPSMRAAMSLYLAPPPAYLHPRPSRIQAAPLSHTCLSAPSALLGYPSTSPLAEQEALSPSTVSRTKLSPTSGDTSASTLITARLADSLSGLEIEFAAGIRRDGPTHPHSLLLARQLCVQYNSAGVRLMEAKQMGAALQLLQKAQLLVEGGGMLDAQPGHQSRLQAITFNNMGCYQQRRGEADKALLFFQRAHGIEALLSDADSPAGTLLNMCCSCSSLGHHREALVYAQKAIRQGLFLIACRHAEIPIPAAKRVTEPLEPEDEDPPQPCTPRSPTKPGAWMERGEQEAARMALQLETVTRDRLTEIFDELPWARELKLENGIAVITGFYNRGAQQEHLGRLSEAQSSYRTAAALACKLFGRGHALSLSSATASESVRQQLLRVAGRGCPSRGKVRQTTTGSRGLVSAK
ncbi:MAG: hypothetical protein WDW38_000671 [Sanguina aurantia]